MPNTYTVTGATGNTGGIVAEKLLAEGHEVRAVARDTQKLQGLASKGAEALTGDIGDADFLTSAYQGADGVFAMIPPNLQADDYLAFADSIGKTHVTAIQRSGVKNVVALSSIGAHLPEGSGIVRTLYDFEQRLNTLEDVNVLVLRPSYFMDNIYMQLEVIKILGVVGSPIAAHVSQPVVATKDIAEVAANRLAVLNKKGHAMEYVLGQRDLSYADITRVLGKALNRTDLQYVQFSRDETAMAMMQMGVSQNIARLLADLAEGINNGEVLGHHRRTPENTTPTSIEEFAEGFARMFQQ